METLGESIQPSRAAQLGQLARQAPNHWLGLDQECFARDYDQKPFLVTHRLHGHPLFQRNALFSLCRRMPRDSVGLRAGRVPQNEDFAESFSHYGQGLELNDVLEHFEERGAYVLINNPERDAQYHDLIEALLGEVADSTRLVDPDITWYSSYIFISSHDSLTPFHMDREMNFLFQIAGAKQIKLWDPADAAVVTPAQKDSLLSYDADLRPPYDPSLDERARVFELRPGLGVHLPFIAPHMVRTASEYSVSLALTFRTRRTDTLTAAHRLNHALRQRGWNPQPVGANPRLDLTKASLTRLVRRSRAAARALGQLVNRT
jgi:hypothetical protein